MSASNLFSPADIAVSTDDFDTELLLLTLDANTLSQQPDIVVSEVPGLPEHQRAVRQTADYFLTEVAHDVTGLSGAVIGFANQFLGFSPRMLELARVLDDAAAPAAQRQSCATELAEGLTDLSRIILRGQRGRDATAQALESLGLRLVRDTTALEGDMALAEKTLEAGSLSALEARISAVQAALARDNSTLAQGAIKGLVSGLEIAVGLALASESAGKGITLVISGFKGAVAVGEAQQAALADVQTQFTAYQDLMARVGRAQVAWAGVQNVSQGARAMTTHQHTAKVALEDIARSWDALRLRLLTLAGQLSTSAPSDLRLSAQLDAATSAWRDFKSDRVRWQADGAPVTPVRWPRLP